MYQLPTKRCHGRWRSDAGFFDDQIEDVQGVRPNSNWTTRIDSKLQFDLNWPEKSIWPSNNVSQDSNWANDANWPNNANWPNDTTLPNNANWPNNADWPDNPNWANDANWSPKSNWSPVWDLSQNSNSNPDPTLNSHRPLDSDWPQNPKWNPRPNWTRNSPWCQSPVADIPLDFGEDLTGGQNFLSAIAADHPELFAPDDTEPTPDRGDEEFFELIGTMSSQQFEKLAVREFGVLDCTRVVRSLQSAQQQDSGKSELQDPVRSESEATVDRRGLADSKKTTSDKKVEADGKSATDGTGNPTDISKPTEIIKPTETSDETDSLFWIPPGASLEELYLHTLLQPDFLAYVKQNSQMTVNHMNSE